MNLNAKHSTFGFFIYLEALIATKLFWFRKIWLDKRNILHKWHNKTIEKKKTKY